MFVFNLEDDKSKLSIDVIKFPKNSIVLYKAFI